MADVQANIIMQTTGGDDAAAEVKKGSDALNNLANSSGNMQAKFQERFQHVGLSLFAGQALSSIGLSGEVRQAVMLMNTALVGGEAAAGIASGGITLLITALVAVGAALYEVYEKTHQSTEALVQQADADAKALVSTNEKIEVLKNYGNVVGGLTPQLQGLLTAEKNVAQDQAGELKIAVDKATASLNDQLKAIKEEMQSVGPLTATYNLLVTAFGLTYLGVEKLTTGVYVSQEAFLKNKKAVDDVVASQKELAFEAAHAGQTFDQYSQKMAQAAQDAKAKTEKAWEEYWTKFDEGAKTELAIWQKLKSDEKKDQDAQTAEQIKAVKQMTDLWEKGAKDIGNSMGEAFAQMITTGESFTDAMTKMFDQLFEKLLQEILELIAEWAIFSAMTGLGGGTAMGLAGQAGLSKLPNFMGGQAIGGTSFADTPTLALFGESGPEMATFSPMSGGGTSSGGAGFGSGGESSQNNNITINVQGGMINQQTLSKIGQYIVQTIRGQGQISFS